ncbi:hypothetical protein EI94DRAFT_1587974, partial [Lactarius quietus]
HTLPGRRLCSVYDHVQCSKHPFKKSGPWADGDDTVMKMHIDEHGRNWNEIEDVMSCPVVECRDRYHKKIKHKGTINRGQWSSDKEARLVWVMQDLSLKGKTIKTMPGFWKEASCRMDNTCSGKQCQEKWTDSLSHTLHNGGTALHWEPQDKFILLQKIASLEVDRDDEIDWNSLPDAGWHQWSAHRLQQKWSLLKAKVQMPEAMHHGESAVSYATFTMQTNSVYFQTLSIASCRVTSTCMRSN